MFLLMVGGLLAGVAATCKIQDEHRKRKEREYRESWINTPRGREIIEECKREEAAYREAHKNDPVKSYTPRLSDYSVEQETEHDAYMWGNQF